MEGKAATQAEAESMDLRAAVTAFRSYLSQERYRSFIESQALRSIDSQEAASRYSFHLEYGALVGLIDGVLNNPDNAIKELEPHASHAVERTNEAHSYLELRAKLTPPKNSEPEP